MNKRFEIKEHINDHVEVIFPAIQDLKSGFMRLDRRTPVTQARYAVYLPKPMLKAIIAYEMDTAYVNNILSLEECEYIRQSYRLGKTLTDTAKDRHPKLLHDMEKSAKSISNRRDRERIIDFLYEFFEAGPGF